MASKVKNMTSGPAGKLILLFAIPLMLGNIFQQLYTMVDTMVVGQIVGVKALASIGAADWLVWLVLGIAAGITQGFSILVSQYYGAGDWERLKKSIAHSYVLTALMAIVVLIVSQAAVHRIMIFLNTPKDIIDMSMTYLRIIFCGIPIISAYNILASVLRAMGNSRSPLIAMIVAALINVVLDLMFVGGFGWGVGGAAAATVIAQTFSAVYCYLVLRKIDLIHLERHHYRLERELSIKLLKLGAPLAVQNMIISIGGLTVQYVVNGFGILFVAGFTATNKMYGVLEMAAISYGYAITTYVGQNLGAGKISRIKSGVRSGTIMAILTSIVVSLIMIAAGKPILSLFISGDPKEVASVLQIAYKYLFIMASFLWVLYLLYVFRSAIQGLGNTVIPLASGLAEFVMRVVVALILPGIIGQNGIFYAEICAWSGAAILLVISYLYLIRKY